MKTEYKVQTIILLKILEINITGLYLPHINMIVFKTYLLFYFSYR